MRSINLFFLAGVVVSILLSFLICADSLGFNSVNTSVDIHKKLFTFLPQGWGFFSRSPRETEICLFKRNGNKFIKMNNYQADPSNLLGVGRNVTRLTYEYQDIMLQIKKTDFISCKSNFQVGYVGVIPAKAVRVINNFDNPRLTGEYLIVMQKLVPWSWISDIEKERMESKIVRINVYEKNRQASL